MQLTSLGFVFLLLPVAAAIYYCFPGRVKPAVLAILSAGFLVLMEPQYAGWLLLSLALDCAASAAMSSFYVSRRLSRALFFLCVGKNLALMALFGLVLPLWQSTAVPVGLMVMSLSSVDALIRQHRGLLPAPSPLAFAAYALFFGRLVLGPVGGPERLLPQITKSKPSLSMIGKGLMLLSLGLFKRVVLADQLAALCKTLARLPAEQITLALGWFSALCGALALYYTLSAYSDIAVGIGRIFSLEFSPMLDHPFEARGIRDHLYRLNMPLEDTVGRLINGGHTARLSAALSVFMPLLLAIWISPSPRYLMWGALLALLVLLDVLLLHRLPAPFAPLAQAVTFVLTLPAYLLLLPAVLSHRLELLAAMFTASGSALYNDAVIYQVTSNALLLLVALFAATSIFDRFSRFAAQQVPRLWWVCSALFYCAILTVTASFLLWNVR